MLRINEKFHGFKVKAIEFPGGMPKFEEKRRFPGESMHKSEKLPEGQSW